VLQVQRKKFAYLTLLLSVVVVQVLSKQLSVQKQKPTYSVSKLFYAVVRLS
jgi:hypothetical protein